MRSVPADPAQHPAQHESETPPPWPFLTRDQYREAVMMGLMLAGCGVVLYVAAMVAAWVAM